VDANIIIREGHPEEYAQVGDLTVGAYQEYADRIAPEWWENYQQDLRAVAERARTARILVADAGGRLAGAVAYFPPGERDEQWFPPDWGFIRMLAVTPADRGHGIGRALTQACIEHARSDGAAGIGLITTHLMTVAKEMYERMGFEQQGEFEWSGGKYWTYALRLDGSAGG
jgi:ribosomal protein S18 acetylase RimI-like enzyme